MGTVGPLVIVFLQVAKSVNQMVHQNSAPIVFNAGSRTLSFTLSGHYSGEHGSFIPGGGGVTGRVIKPQCCTFCGIFQKGLTV